MSWEDIERKGGKSDRTPITAFSEGNTQIRCIDNDPFSFWNHWMQKHGRGAVCLGRDCPICSVITQQKANKETTTYSSTQRHAIRIWNYSTKQMEIMIQGKQFFEQLLNLHREVGDIQTYDIKVTRKGTGTDTTYMCLPMAPKEFEHASEIVEIDFAEQFKPMAKENLLLLMEGKTYDEVFGDKSE